MHFAVFLCTSLKTRVPPKTRLVPTQWTAVNSFSKYHTETSSEMNFLNRVVSILIPKES